MFKENDILTAISDLQSLVNNDSMDDASRTAISTLISKKKKAFVDSVHTRKINDHKGSRAIWWTKIYVEGKKEPQQITATTENLLYEKLFEHYAGQQSLILQDLFEEVMPSLSGKRGRVSDKSKELYSMYWASYFKQKPISQKKITEITSKEWQATFDQIVRDGNLSEKQFRQVLIILNHIINYCLARGYLPYNPIQEALAKDYPFRKEVSRNTIITDGITKEQAVKIIDWCRIKLDKGKIPAIYLLTILFNMIYGLRIGELKGLKWTDVDFPGKRLTVRRQRTNGVEMDKNLNFIHTGEVNIEHNKAYEQDRTLPLSDEALALLKEIKALNISDEYVFVLRRNTYSHHIKEAVKYAGISDTSSIHPHSLRVRAATSVYAKTGDIKVVQALLGHTQPGMSYRYVKGIDAFEKLKGIL